MSFFEIATDGSVCHLSWSFSWIIHGCTSGSQLYGYNTTPATATPLTSFRAECCGYLGALYALRAILKFHKRLNVHPHITARAHIDNKGVVLRSGTHSYSINTCLLPDWDLLHTAQKVLDTLPVSLQPGSPC